MHALWCGYHSSHSGTSANQKFNVFLMIQNEFFSTICIEGKNERGLGPISTAIRWAPKNLMRIQEQGPRARRAFKKSSRNSYFQVVKKKISPPPSKGNEKTNNRPLRAPYCYSRKQCADDDKSWSGIPGSRIFSIPYTGGLVFVPKSRLSHLWQADFLIQLSVRSYQFSVKEARFKIWKRANFIYSCLNMNDHNSNNC